MDYAVEDKENTFARGCYLVLGETLQSMTGLGPQSTVGEVIDALVKEVELHAMMLHDLKQESSAYQRGLEDARMEMLESLSLRDFGEGQGMKSLLEPYGYLRKMEPYWGGSGTFSEWIEAGYLYKTLKGVYDIGDDIDSLNAVKNRLHVCKWIIHLREVLHNFIGNRKVEIVVNRPLISGEEDD